ncbi:MAG: hypothetical protein VYE22_08835 [Myxococcota bacterium]|nr:hypothetical protein [Myxococcota bacterium]
MRALILATLLLGCASESAAEDAAVEDGGCTRPGADLSLGPHPDRIRCPPPPRDRSGVRPSTHAVIDALEQLDAAYCEERRARASRLDEDRWRGQRESLERGIEPSFDELGITQLRPLPMEPLEGCGEAARLASWVEGHLDLFAVDADAIAPHSLGTGEIRGTFRQRWRGLPVLRRGLPAELVVGLPAWGVRSSLIPSWAMPASPEPRVTPEEAHARLDEARRPAGRLGLFVDWRDGWGPRARLVWLGRGCLVDATDGSLSSCAP